MDTTPSMAPKKKTAYGSRWADGRDGASFLHCYEKYMPLMRQGVAAGEKDGHTRADI